MKTEQLIDTMDSVGTRNVYKAYKSAFLGTGKPDKCPDNLWEDIKIWDNFSDVNNEDKSVFELDKDTADHQIKENQSGMKQKYLQDALKLAKDNDKLIGGSKEAKKDVEVMKQRIKDSQSGKDMDYLKKKKDLAAKYEEDYKNEQKKENPTEQNLSEKRDKMEISQKDFSKLMSAMSKINKHFAEEDEEEKDENLDAEVTTEEEEDEEEVDTDANEDEDTETIELPTDVADAIRAALDESDEEEDEEEEESAEEDEDEEVVEEDEEEAEDEDEVEEDESEETEFSAKFYRFAEAITETIENLDKKANKCASKVQDAADEKVIEFSKKDFLRFAESITNTIESLAERVNAIKVPVKNEVTKDLSNIEEAGDGYEEEFVEKSDEETPETPVVDTVKEGATPEVFSKRYENVKNFLTL